MFPQISYSDLWILASYVGLEHTGGPVIDFTPGRVDHLDDSYWSQMSYGRLPAAEKYCCPHLSDSDAAASLDAESGTVKGWEGLCTHVRNEVFYRMGFNDQEIVALLCGGHVYGRCHPNFSGYAGPWVEDMTKFSNEYATDMIEDDWTLVSHGDTWLDDMGAGELRPVSPSISVSPLHIVLLLLTDTHIRTGAWQATVCEQSAWKDRRRAEPNDATFGHDPCLGPELSILSRAICCR